ncbi:TIGR00288 family protein [Acetitomaculum ruminis DSM 5522]|uniref:TIGR00288 family protein n=1 Tax=Acetitomaculum ruminis DSM 5522 TaxID=1120918 RepID=A0A1I0YC95_9FIRM|nr:NYN domain-containing protein [Acetitomaculum ruminis]SFB10386.1 TIGR00288 family protein [Acetitomaculum ruminis DSM 5522]
MGETKEKDNTFAVLIDSDNISAKYISYILAEMTKYGDVTYKRIYGDWTSSQMTKWKKQILENSIQPIQQFSNTAGKNSTDSALIIDAMDILYTDNVDGFCIVSSDSDFTRLAGRLRESGKIVIGMGEEKTPRAFRAACTVFTNLEILLDQDLGMETADNGGNIIKNIGDSFRRGKNGESQTNGDKNTGLISKKVIESDIAGIISENDDKDKATGLGEIGSRLLKKYSDFDVRNYGYSSLSKFLEEMHVFEMVKENNLVYIRLKKKTDKEEIDNYIISLVKRSGLRGFELADLGNKIHHKFEDFNVKDYGYSTFLKLLQGIEGIDVREKNANTKHVYYEEFERSIDL